MSECSGERCTEASLLGKMYCPAHQRQFEHYEVDMDDRTHRALLAENGALPEGREMAIVVRGLQAGIARVATSHERRQQ